MATGQTAFADPFDLSHGHRTVRLIFTLNSSIDCTSADHFIQAFQLVTGDGSGQVVHRPAGGENQWGFGMDIVQQKDTLTEGRDGFIKVGAVKPAGQALQTVQKALLILIGLQLSNDPGASVGKGFVVQVNRILRGEYQAHAKSTGLLEHAQDDRFTGRGGDGGQVADNLIEIH